MDLDKIKLGFWSAAGGGHRFSLHRIQLWGWVTGGNTKARAEEIAANAIAERLGSICVAQFNRDSHTPFRRAGDNYFRKRPILDGNSSQAALH